MATRKAKRWTQYTDEEKAMAVLMLEASGYPKRDGALAHTQRETGIPESTLRTWYNGTHGAPPAKLYAEKKNDLLSKLRLAADKLVDHLIDVADTGDVKETATSLGIVADKIQILSGESTSNVNQKIIIEYVEDVAT